MTTRPQGALAAEDGVTPRPTKRCQAPLRKRHELPRAYQVKRRSILRVFCESCGKRPRDSTLWEVPILESCGEGEEGQLTYETAFRAEIEGR